MKKLLLIISLFSVCAFAEELWLRCSFGEGHTDTNFVINTDNAKPTCSEYMTKSNTYNAFMLPEKNCKVTKDFIELGDIETMVVRRVINRTNGAYTVSSKDTTLTGTCKRIPPIVEKVEKPLF